MFRIVCDPSSGSTELCLTEIALSGSQIEGRTDQRNAQINFSLINLLLFKLLQHVSATQLEPSSGSLKSLQVTSHCNLEHVIKFICTYRWSVLPSIMKMHGPKNKMVHRYFSCAWSVFGSVILNLRCVCVHGTTGCRDSNNYPSTTMLFFLIKVIPCYMFWLR